MDGMNKNTDIIEIKIEPVDQSAIPKTYKVFSVGDLSALGIAGDSIKQFINTIQVPGGRRNI